MNIVEVYVKRKWRHFYSLARSLAHSLPLTFDGFVAAFFFSG